MTLDDVKEFEASRGRNADNRRAGRSGAAAKKKVDPDSDDEEEEEVVPRGKEQVCCVLCEGVRVYD
jgi:hypothetical protein